MKGLLSDVRILDLTRMLAGPYGTLLLADLGAEMIKIEDHRGDYTRQGVQTSIGKMGAYFLALNRNKKSVMVFDIKHPKLPAFKLAGNPIKSSEMEDYFAPPPRLGENTREVLKGVLGYSDEKVDQLNEEKAIGLLKPKKEEQEDDE